MAIATAIQSSQHSTSSKAALIVRQVRVLFSAYRRDDFADPEGFVAQLGVVLEAYADEVIMAVTGPRTGLQRRSKWPPSIAEVVEACDAEANAIATRARYAAMPRFERLDPPARPPAENFDEMVERHGRPLGVFERGTGFEQYVGRRVASRKQTFKKFTVEDLRRLYARNDEAAAS